MSVKQVGFMCGPRIYKFEGWFFEVHKWCGPWPLKKDGELRQRAGKKFFGMYERFNKLSDEEKDECRVGGGCVPIMEKEN